MLQTDHNNLSTRLALYSPNYEITATILMPHTDHAYEYKVGNIFHILQ